MLCKPLLICVATMLALLVFVRATSANDLVPLIMGSEDGLSDDLYLIELDPDGQLVGQPRLVWDSSTRVVAAHSFDAGAGVYFAEQDPHDWRQRFYRASVDPATGHVLDGAASIGGGLVPVYGMTASADGRIFAYGTKFPLTLNPPVYVEVGEVNGSGQLVTSDLPTNQKGWELDPVLTPDGRRVYYVNEQNQRGGILLRRLTSDGRPTGPEVNAIRNPGGLVRAPHTDAGGSLLSYVNISNGHVYVATLKRAGSSAVAAADATRWLPAHDLAYGGVVGSGRFVLFAVTDDNCAQGPCHRTWRLFTQPLSRLGRAVGQPRLVLGETTRAMMPWWSPSLVHGFN